jgi:hypothetical protein
MSARIGLSRGVVLAIASGLALGMAGCSGDDIQFNGGVFDMVGLSDSAKAKTSSGDPKLAERAPLVVPPSLDRLPAPGAAPESPQIAGIKDPDEAKMASQEELQRQQDAYCEVNYKQAMQRGDETTALNAVGPLGMCRPSALNAIKKYNASE